MDYLSYEETVPLLQRSYFGDFRFLTRDDVVKVIQDLSDEPYGLVPETVDKDKGQSKTGKKMTAKEVGKLSKAAQILIMSDERKAAAISNYVRDIIHKELQAVPASNEQTCGYDAILQQISNTEYIYNKDGEQYSADNLRVQMIHFMATYADLVYPEATRLQVLPSAYKQWLMQQLDPQEPLDELGLLGLRLFLKMPLCVVTPLDFKRTSKARDMDEATVFFPYDKDFGLDLSDIPLFLVFNGIDHYCSVQPLKKNFKDGTRALYELLSKARALSDTLAQSTESGIVKGIFQKASENSMASLYSVDKLMINAHEASEEEALKPAEKKRRISGDGAASEQKKEKKRVTKSGNTAWTDFTCPCGVPKQSKEDLDEHKSRRHDEGKFWKCIIEDCPKRVVTQTGVALKKHVQNQHFREFYHWCKYCEYGSDELHLIENHEGEKHRAGVSLPCKKLGFNKAFYSKVSLERHEKYCRTEKQYKCQVCNKGFKRKDNMTHHMKVHTGEIPKMKCTTCLKLYQSKTSFENHIKNKQCYPTDEQEQEMIETINEGELEQLNREVEEGSKSESSEEDSDGEDDD